MIYFNLSSKGGIIMKKFFTVCLMVVVIGITAVSSFAGGHSKDMKCKGHHDKGLDDKFFDKVCFIMLHEEELDITDEQFDQIKDLKYQVKKDLVTKKSEIEVIKIDIKKELWEDTIDTDKLEGMIESKYDLKKEKAKYIVAFYAKLKNILTDDQKEKMKTIWMGYKKEKKYGH